MAERNATKAVLPPEVARKDKRLQGSAEKAALALGKLRWTWCDEGDEATKARNDAPRVSYRGYAKSVELNETTIRNYANAFVRWNADPGLRFLDCLEQEKYGLSQVEVAAAKAVGQVNQTGANKPRSYKAVSRDLILSREADKVETAIEVALAADPEADIVVVAESTARQLKQVRDDAQRENEQVVRDIISRAAVPVIDSDPVGLEYGALILCLDTLNSALKNSIEHLNKNNRFTDDQKAKLKKRYQKAVKGFEALGMAFDAMDTDVDALIGALTEGK